MTDSRKEIDAFINFFATFELTRPVSSISDLADGAALFQVLSVVDADYFRESTSAQSSDNWVIRFGTLKRLYRLMTQYFSDVLQKPTSGLEVPNLQAIAKDFDVNATLSMCRLTIAIGVQCEKNKEFIEKIQGLSETDQHNLMRAIEQVMTRISSTSSSDGIGEATMTEDDHYYRIQSEKSQILTEKEALEKAYQALIEEHRQLQTSHEDMTSERDEALAQARQAKRELDNRRVDNKADVMARAEIDRLRGELQKSEDNLAAAESEVEHKNDLVADLTRKLEDAENRAAEGLKWKDKYDESRHANEKLQKMENVMDKYKKKLQEGAELRQTVKGLEKQNSDLVDKNAALEEEYRKVAAFKPLLESYKNQIADLESRNSSRAQEIDKLKFELEQTRTQLKISTEERAKDSETLELYQERVRELELASNKPPKRARSQTQSSDAHPQGEPLSEAVPQEGEEEDFDDDATEMGLGGELNDALSGTTMTDLKIQIKKLKRELESVRKNEADASNMLVMENLLEDANRMKQRYEADYLAAHREKLVLQKNLDEIRSGKSMGDGAEAAIALRQRLNETVDQLEELRKAHAELEVKFESQEKELTIAKSDLTLVNRDQLDILASLRESVNEDKAALEVDIEKLRKQNKELSDKNRMQLEQVNALLLEKVNLQSEGIGQREKMLQRERDFGELRATLSGKDLPEDIKSRLLALHEENVMLKETNKTTNEKLIKARQFIKEQDKLFREQHASQAGTAPAGTFEEARSQVKILEDDLARQKSLMKDLTKRYQREQALMLSVVHSMGMNTARGHLGGQRPSNSKPAWLSSVRNTNRLQRVARPSSYSPSPFRLVKMPAIIDKIANALHLNKGHSTASASPAFDEKKVIVIFVLGGPGVGKGTQCARLVQDFNFCHLSGSSVVTFGLSDIYTLVAGDLLRAEQNREGSEYGKLIKDCIKEGNIVPMEVTVKLLQNAMTAAINEKKGGEGWTDGRGRFLIDGFPRKMDQAEKFEEEVCKAAMVLFFTTTEEVMLERLLERGKTSGREDDNVESIKKRFHTYKDKTMPVVEHYEKLGKVAEIDSSPTVDEVHEKAKAVVQKVLDGIPPAASS
ncbi:hypothetical protein VNI00_008341 [Paramarasmius palmivorus]|uniref:Uridylate kinase n=1 Tax=Paramarasmius palmivorus TaxID=297713 RepID=A0AAW0CXY8_9AGAR